MREKTYRREPKKMTVSQLIWKLIKLRFKYGNLPVKTWIQYQEGHVNYANHFISIC